MKKLLAIILALAMVISVLAIEVAFATTEPAITVETVEAKAGDTVAVKVSISNNPGIWGLKVKIVYDRSILTLTSVENGDFFASSEWTKGDINKETYTLSYGANDFADITTVSGTLATLTFSVSDTATAGDYNIDVSYVVGDIINSNLDDVSFAMVNGKVSIKEETPANPEGILQYLTYTIENGEVTITDFDETVSGDIEIPATIEGYPVTNIGYEAFYCCQISGITLPDTIVSIETSAFYACENLNKIDLGENLKTIGYAAFERCRALKEVNFPESLEIISEYAFIECDLECIAIPDNVTTIGSFAFQSNESLKSISIGANVSSIGWNAFIRKNNNLTAIFVDESNERYYTDGTILIDNVEKTIIAVCNVENIVIPEGIQTIGDFFSGSNKLISVTIPNGVTSINRYAFMNCSSLTDIFLPDSITNIAYAAFAGCDNLTTVYYTGTEEQWNDIVIYEDNDCLINANIVYEYGKETTDPLNKYQYFTYEISDGEVTITDCDETVSGDIEIPATIEGYPVTKIGYGAFSLCTDIQNIKLPESICYIGDAALERCTSLVSVNIPQNVSYIGWYCFDQCYKLESIELPTNITTIDNQTFGFCKSLKTIVIPEGVTGIASDAFLGCENLETIYLPNTLLVVGEYVFSRCDNLKTIEYNGTEQEWAAVEIDKESNTILENVTIIFKNASVPEIEGTIIGATVDIGSSLTINYFADAPENAVMKFTSSSGRATEVNGVYDEKTGYYKFAYTGINPQCMSDVIKAELMNGETVLDTKESYSVKDYCENQAGKTASQLKLTNGQYEALKTFMADMLVYGSAAQKYKNYNTENLPDTSPWVSAYKSTFNVQAGVKRISGNADSENKVKSVGLNMANVNRIYFKLILNDESIVVTLNDQIIDVSALAKNNDGTYMLYSPDVFATGFSDVYTLKLTKNSDVISTVEYNVNAYIEAKCETNGLSEILKSLSNYGNAAKAYQNVSTDGDFDLDEDQI